MGIASRKSLETCTAEAYATEGPQLRRTIGVIGITAFGVGSTVGAGIFSWTGEVAAQHAGPAVSLAFVLASVACFFAGLCYAEFAAMVPISGSAYTYAYVTLGELTAWLIGWSLVLEWLFSASAVAISWSGYVTAALRDAGLPLSPLLSRAPFSLDAHQHLIATGSWFDLPAVLVVAGCTVLMLAGMRTSSLVNAIIVTAKILVLIVLIAVAARYVNPAHWHPFVPANTGTFGSFGPSGVLRGTGILFFAYIGFDGVSTLAQDARNPQRTMPISMFASLAICTALYVAVGIVITGLVDYRSLGVTDPLYFALSSYHAPSLVWIRRLVAFVAIVGLLSVVLASIVGQVRIFYSMARDGLLPQCFAKLRGGEATPVAGTLVTGAFATAMAAVVPFDALGEIISSGTLLAFVIVCIGILVLRRTAPQTHRPFRTPWVPVVPVLGAASCLVLMMSLGLANWIRLIAWMIVGAIVYLAYGRRHSRLRK